MTEGNGNIPPFFELLRPKDREEYLDIIEQLLNSEKRYKKNMRIEGLREALDIIRNYCIRGDSDDWRRCLVCGVCWIGPQDIGINIRQLKQLVSKCKSSINGALLKMGYGTVPVKSVITAALLQYIPYLKGNYLEQGQWTIRRKCQFSPLPGRCLMTPMKTPQNTAVTPQPQVSPPAVENVAEMNEIFGLEQNEEQKNDEYNFITDPVCCCPVDWLRDDDMDTLFDMA